jgi:hypothetical protein
MLLVPRDVPSWRSRRAFQMTKQLTFRAGHLSFEDLKTIDVPTLVLHR